MTRILSYREIAEILGISHASVQNIERRALEKMRKEAERIEREAAEERKRRIAVESDG